MEVVGVETFVSRMNGKGVKIGLKLTESKEAQAEIAFEDKYDPVSPFLGKHKLSILPSDVARF